MTDAPWKNAESTELDDGAVARVAQNVVQLGPSFARRGRRIQRAKRAGAVVGVCGALALVWLFSARELAVSPPPPRLACADWASARGLDIGRRGTVAADGEVRLKEAAPCRTVFELLAGRITVHAEDLGGGELAVVSGEEEVVVRGTLFSVERSDSATIISTEEGLVEVVGRARVPAGWRARVTRNTVKQVALDRVDGERMRKAVGMLAEIPEPAEEAEPLEDGIPPETKSEAPIERTEPRRTRVRKRGRRKPAARPRSVAPAEPVKPPPSASELVQRAHRARKTGDLDAARRHFREAGTRSGPTAEAAWLGLARMELTAKRPRAARDALRERAERFSDGVLEPEAAWLEVRALDEDGDERTAQDAARRILKRWPDSPQADLARRFLEE